MTNRNPTCRIGIIRDAAFTFYHPENLEALEEAGVELVFVVLRAVSRAATENDLPVYAECGGLMCLSRSLQRHDKRCERVGAQPLDIEVMNMPQGHGYAEARVAGDNPFFARDQVVAFLYEEKQHVPILVHSFDRSCTRRIDGDLDCACRAC